MSGILDTAYPEMKSAPSANGVGRCIHAELRGVGVGREADQRISAARGSSGIAQDLSASRVLRIACRKSLVPCSNMWHGALATVQSPTFCSVMVRQQRKTQISKRVANAVQLITNHEAPISGILQYAFCAAAAP